MSDIAAVVAARKDALTEQYQVITQNIANANTSGYKRGVTSFAVALASAQGGASGPTSVTQTDFSQGHLTPTGRNLDLALEGKGFFTVDTPNGETYTRGGVFNLNAQGQLVDYAGNPVAGESGPITVPRTARRAGLTVSASGDVAADRRSRRREESRSWYRPCSRPWRPFPRSFIGHAAHDGGLIAHLFD